MAQVCHAAAGSGPATSGTYAVVLAASSESELLNTSFRLAEHGIHHITIHEPDAPYLGAATAIGIPPQARQQLRRVLIHLPLYKG